VRNQRDMESFDQLLAGELDLSVRSREALPHGLPLEERAALADRLLRSLDDLPEPERKKLPLINRKRDGRVLLESAAPVPSRSRSIRES